MPNLRDFVRVMTLEDGERFERSAIVNDKIKTLKINSYIMTRTIAETLKISQCGVQSLIKLGYMNYLDVWVPHKLTEKNLMDCFIICLTHCLNETKTSLKRTITRDKKWIVYNNIERKELWENSEIISRKWLQKPLFI